MHMASQPRRAAILLARVATDELKVMFSRKGEYDLPVRVAGIDVEAGTVELALIHKPGQFVVPLDAVRMVWFDLARKEWHAAVDGSFRHEPGKPPHYFLEQS